MNKKETSVLVMEKMSRHGGGNMAASVKTVGKRYSWQEDWLSNNLEKC